MNGNKYKEANTSKAAGQMLSLNARLREQYAGQAMQALITLNKGETIKQVVSEAVKFADAMIEALNKE